MTETLPLDPDFAEEVPLPGLPGLPDVVAGLAARAAEVRHEIDRLQGVRSKAMTEIQALRKELGDLERFLKASKPRTRKPKETK